MSFGDRHLDNALDRWLTTDPRDYIDTLRLSHKLRKAKKIHRCNGCNRDIQPGESYWYSFFLVDGEPYSQRICNQCPFD